MFDEIINNLWEWLYNLLLSVINLLPDSPFGALNNSVIVEYLPYINYFIDFNFFLATGSAWLIAVGAFYVRSLILRWTKAIN